jgi:hypothetical protein
MTVAVTFLNVLLGDVEGKMAGMFVDIWTKVMPGLQAVFVAMQKIVGVKKRSWLQTAQKI